MKLLNNTYTTDLDKWKYGNLVKNRISILKENFGAILDHEYYLFTNVNRKKLELKEFEIGYREDLTLVDLKPGESKLKLLTGDMDRRRLRARYAISYSYRLGKVDVIVPEINMLYVIQDQPYNKKFIQWATHNHDEKSEKIMKNAKWALFQNVSAPISPLVAIINDLEAIVMGEGITGSTGHFKELA